VTIACSSNCRLDIFACAAVDDGARRAIDHLCPNCHSGGLSLIARPLHICAEPLQCSFDQISHSPASPGIPGHTHRATASLGPISLAPPAVLNTARGGRFGTPTCVRIAAHSGVRRARMACGTRGGHRRRSVRYRAASDHKCGQFFALTHARAPGEQRFDYSVDDTAGQHRRDRASFTSG
jgi:hypothetical protein